MRTTTDRLKIVFLLSFAFLTGAVACGGHGSPTAPSSTSPEIAAAAPAAAASAGATIVGTMSGASSAATAGWRASNMAGVIVTVVGTTVSGAVDSSGTFTLTNVPPSQVVLNFSGPGIDASLPLGAIAENDRVQISVTVSGTTASLDTPIAVTISGTVEGAGGTCPVATLKVRGAYVRTDAATTFTGKACADINNGDSVEGVGTRQTDGSVLATRMAVTAAPPVTFSGTVEGAGGTCPVATLKVSGVYVKTNAATAFTGKACADINNGDTVEGVGTRQTDGSVLARTLKVGN